MADRVNAAYRAGDFRLIPEFHGDVLERWHDNLRDWCISRQLWWGHRIPVWYCDGPEESRVAKPVPSATRDRESRGCGNVIVSRDTPTRCDRCGGALVQDEDVLDTWFSSWLVPFTSLGWPDETPDLAAFYPGHTMVTAPEILFLWVSRMIMSGLEFMGQVPFRTIYLHGTVRDTQHIRKMSKSAVTRQRDRSARGDQPVHGADAFRYTVVERSMSVWNSTLIPRSWPTSTPRLPRRATSRTSSGTSVASCSVQLPDSARPLDAIDRDQLSDTDRWILTRAQATIAESTQHYEAFRLNEATATIYHFIWSDFADWYLEEQIKSPGFMRRRRAATWLWICRGARLRYRAPPAAPGDAIHHRGALAATAESSDRRIDRARGMAHGEDESPSASRSPKPIADPPAQDLVTGIRNIRADYNVPPGQKVNVLGAQCQRGREEPAARQPVRAAATVGRA